MRLSIRAVLTTIFLSNGAVTAAGAQELSPAEEVVIEEEVTAAVERYYQLFSEHDMAELPRSVYHIPWVQIGTGGVRAETTSAEALAGFEASLAGLIERDWERSVFTTVNVCVLNASAAIASGYNTRYRTDGEVMSVGGVSYLFGKTDDGWRIVSYSGHSADKVVRCD